VTAAARLFRERGVDGVGLNELMREAGFTQGGFYNHSIRRTPGRRSRCNRRDGHECQTLRGDWKAAGGSQCQSIREANKKLLVHE